MATQTGMAIGIEFGEISTGVSAMLGVAQGMMKQEVLNDVFRQIGPKMEQRFGANADVAGARGDIAHVYEYNMTGHGVDASRAGRLWDIVWKTDGGGTVGYIDFKESTVESKPDPALVSQVEAESGGKAEMATHKFRDKAKHLETTKTLISRAGIQRHTERQGGSPNPRMLVFLGSDGKAKFAKRHQRSNQFYNRFRDFFIGWWTQQMENNVEPKVKGGTLRTVHLASRDVNVLIRKASMSVVRMPPMRSTGVFPMDHGKPYTGIRIRATDVKAMENKVIPKFKKEMLRSW